MGRSRVGLLVILAGGVGAGAESLGGCGLDIVGTELLDSADGQSPATASNDRSSGSSDSTGSSGSGGPTDAETDADTAAPDASIVTEGGLDATFSICPSACSSCSDAGERECRIDCPGAKCSASTVQCPPNMPCRIVCVGTQSCASKTLRCAAGRKCTIVCEGDETCQDTTFQAGDASALCVQCKGLGNPACPDVSCQEPTSCTCATSGSCGCSGCGTVGVCP